MPSGSNIDQGASLVTSGYSAGALNANLIPSVNISNYKWISLYIGPDSYSGTLTFQGSFDGSTWDDIMMYRLRSLDGTHTASSVEDETSTLMGAPVRYPLFRCRMTTYTSGTSTAILELRNEGLAGLQLITPNVNDGTASAVITAGVASDTVLYSGKSMLSRILVTTTGTAQMVFYDNASTGNGTPVGIIPANSPVNGVPFVCKAFCANGITAKGNANNPGVTVFYADLIPF